MNKQSSIVDIVMIFHNQALLQMGIINLPDTKVKKDLKLAKQFIDYIDIIKDKTKGNLEPNEEKQITDSLINLKMLFVKVQDENNKKKENKEEES